MADFASIGLTLVPGLFVSRGPRYTPDPDPPAWTEGKPKVVPNPIKGTVTPIRGRTTSGAPNLVGVSLYGSIDAAAMQWAWEFQQRAIDEALAASRQPAPLPDPIVDVPIPEPAPPPAISFPPVELPEIVVSPPPVSTPAPIPVPAPIEVPEIIFNPAQVPFGIPTGLPAQLPGTGPRSSPAPASAPRGNPALAINPNQALFAGLSALNSLFNDSFGLPVSTSSLARPRTNPTGGTQPSSPTPTAPIAPGSPLDFLSPVTPRLPSLPSNPLDLSMSFLPDAHLQPRNQLDLDEACKCPEKKTKKREPKPPRTVCKQGTYTQRARGISYSPGKEVPCAPALPRGVKRPSIGSVAKTVFSFGL